MTHRVAEAQETLAYYADQARDESRPPEILLGLCSMLFREHDGFRIKDGAKGDGDGLYYLSDVETLSGISATQLMTSIRMSSYG